MISVVTREWQTSACDSAQLWENKKKSEKAQIRPREFNAKKQILESERVVEKTLEVTLDPHRWVQSSSFPSHEIFIHVNYAA